MSEQSKDQIHRWMPTIVAIIGIIGSLLYSSREYGRLEYQVKDSADALKERVTRAEYVANRDAQALQYAEVKQSLTNISNKLDRMLEAQYEKH